MVASTILVIVLVLKAARMGQSASAAVILPEATSDATEMAAAWVSTKPAKAAAATTPASPNHSRNAAEASMTMERVRAKMIATFGLKALPDASAPSGVWRSASRVKIAP